MTDSDIIQRHAEKELYHARYLIQEDRYEEAAEALRQVASRYDSLSEIEQARADHPSVSSLPSEPTGVQS